MADKNTTISKKVRFEIFKRDKFTCQYCGKSSPNVVLHVDHIHPKAKGGKNDATNLITSCSDCNLGKGARLLDDNSAIDKRKKQLDELQEKREQLDMMVEWHKGLLDLDSQVIEEVCGFWNEIVFGYSISEYGIKQLRQVVKRFGINEVLEAIRISTDNYLEFNKDGSHTKESVEKAFQYIPKICSSRKNLEKKPYLQDLYYIRGILKNRRANSKKDWQSVKAMEDAHLLGVDIDEIKELAKEVDSWDEFYCRLSEIAGIEL